MGQNPHVGKCVHVVGGVDRQRLAVAFRIVVGDEGVGGATVTRGISPGLWVTKGGDSAVLEGRLEVESVLESLDLTEPGVFAGGNAAPATVVNLWCVPVSHQ